ncbi:hypothetical protein GCM10022399_13710 [Terrabacter ginsenosidimutans]|uniref:LysM domain-containing protein n=1 Tax=Terrabacter ginsenosidimutans TaxID=490575 RepID=A0ABP7D391_9MICO
MLREVLGSMVGLAVAAAALTLFVTVVRRAPAIPGATRPDDVLLVLLGWVGLLMAAWLALGCLLAVAALLPGTAGRAAASIADRVTPVAVRKVLALVLGASVGSLALPPALASVAGSGPVTRSTDPQAPGAGEAATRDITPDSTSGSTAGLTPGFTPSEASPGFVPTVDLIGTDSRAPGVGCSPGYVPTAPPAVHDADRSRLLAPAPRATTAAHDLVPVRRGDSLWSIAARHLGPTASDAEVAWEWPRWYAANRDVVGDDPDLLTPGQLLRPPSRSDSRPSAPHPSSPTAGAETSAPGQQGAQ